MSISVVAVVFGALVVGLVAGAVLGLLAGSARTRSRYSVELAQAQTKTELLTERTANLEADAAIAAELTAAVGPLAASVRDLKAHMHQQDHERIDQIARLSENITSLTQQNAQLHASTTQLSNALHSTSARGDWGEVQLKRIVEYSGLLPHVDFDTQVTTQHGRPDMVVHLPGGGTIVVDAKVPLSSRLSENNQETAKQHAQALLRHVDALASKTYWKSFDQSPEFVVCFIPTDGLLSHAAATYPALIEQALSKNVVIASPSTLLVLLKTVALNWRHYNISTSAAQVLKLGTELYERTGLLTERLTKLGATLERATQEYNSFIGSFETRFLVTARKLTHTGITNTQLDELNGITTSTRNITAQELAYPTSPETLPQHRDTGT